MRDTGYRGLDKKFKIQNSKGAWQGNAPYSAPIPVFRQEDMGGYVGQALYDTWSANRKQSTRYQARPSGEGRPRRDAPT